MKLCLREDCQIYMDAEKHVDKLDAKIKALKEEIVRLKNLGKAK